MAQCLPGFYSCDEWATVHGIPGAKALSSINRFSARNIPGRVATWFVDDAGTDWLANSRWKLRGFGGGLLI
jgi:hypothetical protein